MKKVLKFGGTSLAVPENLKKVKKIIKSTKGIKYIVVSAPGKRFKEDIKVTDLLYQAFNFRKEPEKYNEIFEAIKERFNNIVTTLNIDISLENDFEIIKRNIRGSANNAYAASRGEYLMGMIAAKYLDLPFVDAANTIIFNKNGIFNYKRSEKQLIRHLKNCASGAVIPGFYGATLQGRVFTFSRGGSDYTGSVVAAVMEVDVYENWTDVNGFLSTDPKIVSSAQFLKTLNFRSLRDLSYMGAGVLHSDCVFPLKNKEIPIIIKNTFNPEHDGTKIIEFTNDNQNIIYGITGKKNLIKIIVEKHILKKNKIKTVSQLLNILKKFNLTLEHILVNVDSISFVIEEECYSCIENYFLQEVDRIIEPDNIVIKKNIAIIAIVGTDLTAKEEFLPKIFLALDGIKIRMIDFGCSKSNILIGVKNEDFNIAIKRLHEKLF